MACGCGAGAQPVWFGNNVWRCNACGDDCLAVRPQGPVGPAGPDGITPAFEVGTVEAGGAPAVTITAVSPTLYRLDFILPETYTAGDNIWTGSNTFLGDVIVSGAVLYANGGLSTTFLTVTEGGTLSGTLVTDALVLTNTSTLTVAGTSVFNGDVTLNGTTTVSGDFTANGTVIFAGNVEFDFPALGSAGARGRVVIDECNVLKYLEGSGFTTPETDEYTTPVTVNPGDPETQLATPVTITVPSLACPPETTYYLDVMVRIETLFSYAATGSWAFNLWGGSIGGNLLDTFQAGPGVQQVILRQIQVAVSTGGSLTLYVSAVDGTDPPDTLVQSLAVKWWIK